MWELSARSSRVIRLRDVALPFMDDLHAVVRQHTQLGVLDGDEVLHVERLSAPGSIVNATYVAGRLPAHARAREPLGPGAAGLLASHSPGGCRAT